MTSTPTPSEPDAQPAVDPDELPDGSPSVPDADPAEVPDSLADEPNEDPAKGLPDVEATTGPEGS